MLPKQPNQSLIDGLTCLQALATAAPTGVRELARELGMEPTRAHRLLKTLAHLGLAEQTGERKYRAGPGIHVLAATSLYASGLMRRALEPLETLGRRGLIVALGVRWMDQVAYLYHAGPGMTTAEGIGRVGPFPASQSGLGLALLAGMDDQAVRELYHLRAVAGFKGVGVLMAELKTTRVRGYADVQREDGDRTLAVGVAAQHGPPTVAVGLAGKIGAAKVKGLVAELREAAGMIGGKNVAHEKVTQRKGVLDVR